MVLCFIFGVCTSHESEGQALAAFLGLGTPPCPPSPPSCSGLALLRARLPLSEEADALRPAAVWPDEECCCCCCCFSRRLLRDALSDALSSDEGAFCAEGAGATLERKGIGGGGSERGLLTAVGRLGVMVAAEFASLSTSQRDFSPDATLHETEADDVGGAGRGYGCST